jgi:DNA-binding beta-propeller fold protein YncE
MVPPLETRPQGANQIAVRRFYHELESLRNKAYVPPPTSLKRIVLAVFSFSLLLAAGTANTHETARSAQTPSGLEEIPHFRVDPRWEKIPTKWVLGQVSGIDVDATDHVWVLHRPSTAKPETGRVVAPPVLEFDSDGNLMQAWGGPDKRYEWPTAEHGIFVDYRGFIWITGSGTDPDAGNDQILKFDQNGTFILQIGHKRQSKGNTDRNNLGGPAAVSVDQKTNEVFVADGFFNRRVIVFDGDTGAFKKMWGAFGSVPKDSPGPVVSDGGNITREHLEEPGPAQFSNVHCLKLSNDGLVYVCDKGNERIQVFTTSGKYVTQLVATSANSVAFSRDSQERFLYIADRSRSQVLIYNRRTLTYLGALGGGPGEAPGQFSRVHDLSVDSKGNIFTAEESDSSSNRRVQKFVLERMSLGAEQ